MNLEKTIVNESNREKRIVSRLIRQNQPLTSTEIVDKGHHGILYKLNDHYVVKVPKHANDRGDNVISNEYVLANEIYRKFIPIPRPIGLFKVVTDYFGEIRKNTGFVMEFVRNDGCAWGREEELKRRVDRELEKCVRRGFIPKDTWWGKRKGHNVLYDKEKDKIYLIDFCLWERV